MASTGDKIDMYLARLSSAERDEFLKKLYYIYISPNYLAEHKSFDYYGFHINTNILRPIVYQYVLDHPERPALADKFFEVKRAEAIQYLHINVPEYERQFNRFLNGETLTREEKVKAEKYANQYVSSRVAREYQKMKAAVKPQGLKNTKTALAYRKFCQYGYSDEFFDMADVLRVSRAELVTLPLQYIQNELTGVEQEEALQKNLHTMRQFIEQIQQEEHDKKVQNAKTLLEGVLAVDAHDVSALCKQLSISRKDLEQAIAFLKKENHSDVQNLISQVAKRYRMEDILLDSRIKNVAHLVKIDSEKGLPISAYRILEYAFYIGQPINEIIYHAGKILPEEEFRPFSSMLHFYDAHEQLCCCYHAAMIFQEKKFHKEQDGSISISAYQLNDEEKQSILDFFERHNIAFGYMLYSVAAKRMKDGSFDPNGDLTLTGEIFPTSTVKINQKKND